MTATNHVSFPALSRTILSGALACALALACLSFASGPAAARNFFGAIAYSFSNGAVGYSHDHPSRARAEADALRRCRKYGGGCKVVIWFGNGCGALAVNAAGAYGAYWDHTRAAAQNNALSICRKYGGGCGIRAWSCTTR